MSRAKIVLLLGFVLAAVWASRVLAASSKNCMSDQSTFAQYVANGSLCGEEQCEDVKGGGCDGPTEMLSYQCRERTVIITFVQCTFTFDGQGHMTSCSYSPQPALATSSARPKCPS